MQELFNPQPQYYEIKGLQPIIKPHNDLYVCSMGPTGPPNLTDPLPDPYPECIECGDLYNILNDLISDYYESPLYKFVTNVENINYGIVPKFSSSIEDDSYIKYYNISYLASIIISLNQTNPLSPLVQMANSELKGDYEILIPRLYYNLFRFKTPSQRLNLTVEKCINIKNNNIKIWQKMCRVLPKDQQKSALFMPKYFIDIYNESFFKDSSKHKELRTLMIMAGVETYPLLETVIEDFEVWLLDIQNNYLNSKYIISPHIIASKTAGFTGPKNISESDTGTTGSIGPKGPKGVREYDSVGCYSKKILKD